MNEMPERLLKTSDAASVVGLSVKQLERHRSNGSGPVYVKLSSGRSGSVRYRRADLEEWIAGLRRKATSP